MTFSTLASPGVSLQGGGGSGGGGGGTPGGSNTQIQYNSSGTFAGASGLTTNGTELTIASGTKTADAPVLNMSQTWNNSGVTFTGLKFNAATGSNTGSASGSLLMDLQLEGTSRFSVNKSGTIQFGPVANASQWVSQSNVNIMFNAAGSNRVQLGLGVKIGSGSSFQWSSTTDANDSPDTILTRRAAANLRLGAADAAAPVAQTLSVQSVVAGTTNTAGANLTITGSQGTGTGAGGSIIFQVAPAGSTGSAQNALADALTIASSRAATFAGQITVPNSGVRLGTDTTGLTVNSSFTMDVIVGSTQLLRFIQSGGVKQTVLPSDGTLSWSNAANFIGAVDLFLARDDANILAQRNGNNGQTFRIYGRFTDITNDFERFFISVPTTSGAAVQLGTQKGATAGTARALELQTNGVTRLTIATNGSIAVASNTYIGLQPGALQGNNGLYWGSSFEAQATSAGVLTYGHWAGSNNVRVNFGGTTSSFPALKRSSASLIVRLADDTANAALESASLKTDAPAGGTSATWKLGTVASVSPTSPNRTIEVDIGGTIYYLHAKTTND